MSVPGLVDECIYMNDGDWDYVYNEISKEIIRSPKEHVCIECGMKIPPLKKHELFIAMESSPYEEEEDGKVEYIRTCMTCVGVIRDFTSGGRSFGLLWEYMSEVNGICGPDDMPDYDEDEEDERARAEYLLRKT